MTTRYKTQAFTFQKSDTNEADRVFSVFSNNYGRLDLFAKAIRKINSKLKGGINIFSFSDIEFIQGKNRKTLTDSSTIKRFDNINDNLEKFNVANKIGNVLEDFLKGEEMDVKVFDLLGEIFSELNDIKTDGQKSSFLYYYFLWNFLAIQGYKPEVANCVRCRGKIFPESVHFSLKNGGVVCKKCSILDTEDQEINSDIVKTLRLILKKDWAVLSKLRVGRDSWEIFKKNSDNYNLYILSGHSSKNNYSS